MLKEAQMKLIMTLIVGLSFFNLTAYSQITDTDLNKIRSVIKEEVEKAIETSEKRMKEYVTQEIAKVDIKLSEMDKRLNHIFTLVITLIALIAVAVGVPQVIVAIQRKEMRAQDKKIEMQQNQIENLLKEIEILKQGRIVSP